MNLTIEDVETPKSEVFTYLVINGHIMYMTRYSWKHSIHCVDCDSATMPFDVPPNFTQAVDLYNKSDGQFAGMTLAQFVRAIYE